MQVALSVFAHNNNMLLLASVSPIEIDKQVAVGVFFLFIKKIRLQTCTFSDLRKLCSFLLKGCV